MAGRGRGRGISFNIEALGFGRGEALPVSGVQPPPTFPIQIFKPIDLLQTDDTDYMLALKQEFRGASRKSAHFLNLTEKKKDIERYTDKYQLGQNDSNGVLKPDWNRLPAELRTSSKRVQKTKVKPNVSKETKSAENLDVLKKFENLESKDGEGDKEKDAEGNEDGSDKEAEEEVVYDEDDLEEDTDYNLNYFDNGEEYEDNDDDVDEGPTY